MSKNFAEYTNFLPLFDDLGLNSETDMLWLLHHNDRTNLEDLRQCSVWKQRQKIFLIDSEWCSLDDISWQTDSRIHMWTPCVLDCKQSNLYLFWFNWMQEIETSLNCTQRLQALSKKEYYFDALLGTPRGHKNIVYNLIQNLSDKDKFLTSYTGNPYNNFKSKWIRGCDYEDNRGFVTYNNTQQTNASVVIPYKIYNQCWYSLVAETSGEQPNFYTEKTGKPLLSKRLFVMFAAQHHLKHLKEVGFCTFDGIIDESYDDEPDLHIRYNRAWEQVEFLLEQDPIEIYKLAEPILEHNRNHFMNTNWQKEMYEKIQNISQLSK